MCEYEMDIDLNASIDIGVQGLPIYVKKENGTDAIDSRSNRH
jgi:hypothetical protein